MIRYYTRSARTVLINNTVMIDGHLALYFGYVFYYFVFEKFNIHIKLRI